GLGNSSGVLGHYLMDHHCDLGSRAEMPGFDDRYTYGFRPVGFYMPRYRNISQATRRADFVRGYGLEGGSNRAGWQRGIDLAGFGAEFKRGLRQPGSWYVRMDAFGETLPRYENHVRLDPSRVDSFGIPQLVISCEWGENELAMRKDIVASTAEMLEACGGKNVETHDLYVRGGLDGVPGNGIHEMGTARMGRDPKTSVLNAHNQCHDVPNVFVTDVSCMASSPCQNPSITYMALTARACNFAVAELKRRTL